MILDERTEFLDSTALSTAAAGSYIIGDVVDLMGSLLPLQNRDIGWGEPIYLVVTADVVGVGAGTVAINLVTDDNSGMSSPTVIVTAVPATNVTNFTAGKVMAAVALPTEGVPYERYIGIQQVSGGSAVTSGNISAFLVLDVAKWRTYQDAQN